MRRKKHTATEIAAKLKQVESLLAQGLTVGNAVRTIGVTDVTYYKWRSDYGRLGIGQLSRATKLEAENARLKRLVSDLTTASDL
jgi:putative transposase